MNEFASSTYPVLPLRDIVVFPHMIVPLFVGREKSVRALEAVMESDSPILLAAQKDANASRSPNLSPTTITSKRPPLSWTKRPAIPPP